MTHELGALYPLGAGVATAAAWATWKLRKLRAPRDGARYLPTLRNLPRADGERFTLDPAERVGLVLLFTSNRCPGAKAYDARMRALYEEYAGRGIAFVAVNSVSDVLHGTESLAQMARAASERRIPFPYVKDADQSLARALDVACTPQVFLADGSRRILYRGRIDDSFVESRAKRPYLRDAIEDLLASRPVTTPETAPLGCNLERVLAT